MSDTDLQAILESGDRQQALQFFLGMSEVERRRYAPVCKKWFAKIKKNATVKLDKNSYGMNPLLSAAAIAAVSTATCAELKKLSWQAQPRDEDLLAIVSDRSPDWLSELLLHDQDRPRRWFSWHTIRKLVRAGLCTKPDHPTYYLAMLRGMNLWDEDDADTAQKLLADPELLEDEVWRLFELEGTSDNSLANSDSWRDSRSWGLAFIKLSESGHPSRERLIACTFDALERDFNHYRAKWFTTFHDKLGLTLDEQQRHAQRYLNILQCSAPPVVSWAFKAVQDLHKKDPYDAQTLVAALAPVLLARAKGIVKQALQVIAKLAEQEEAVRRIAASTAVKALGHEAADVQEAALACLEATGASGDADLLEQVAQYSELIAPSVKKRLDKLAGTPADAPPVAASSSPAGSELQDPAAAITAVDPKLARLFALPTLSQNLSAHCLEIPAATFDGMDIPRLDEAKRLQPIETLEELVEVCARAIEDDPDIDDVERSIDGLSRLCEQRPDDFTSLTSPLKKRAHQRLKTRAVCPFVGADPSGDVTGIVYAWLEGIVLRSRNVKGRGACIQFEDQSWQVSGGNLHKPIGTLSTRCSLVAERVGKREPQHMLSAPTHRGGWIDPLSLAERIERRNDDDPDLVDVCLAMLRLAPDNRTEALQRMPHAQTEWQQALHHALGASGIAIGKEAALWISAARARQPWADDADVEAAFPAFGPDAGCAAEYAYTFNKNGLVLVRKLKVQRVKGLMPPSVVFHVGQTRMWELGGIGGHTISSVRWSATIWPQAHEALFAGAAVEVANNLDWWEAEWRNRSYMEPLLDPGTPLRQMGLLLLCFGLAAKEPGEHGLATDVAIAAIQDGRLGTDNWGPQLAELLSTDLIKLGRWAKTLGDVARVSPMHASVVQRSLQRAARGDPAKLPRDFGKLLDLLNELSLELGLGIDDEDCRTFLAGIGGSGKPAKLAKALLARDANAWTDQHAEIVQTAIAHRVARIQSL